MNEEEILAVLNKMAASLEKMTGTVDESTKATEAATKAEEDFTKNLTSLGLVVTEQKTIESARKKANEDRIKLEEEINKKLSEQDENFKKLSSTQKEAYKTNLKNQKAMDDALASIGRYVNENGKLVKQTGGLTQFQEAYIATLRKSDEVQRNLLNNSTKLAADLAKLAITSTFNMFVAGLKGAWEGANAYTDAILEGAGANSAAAAQVSAEMNSLASAIEATGSSMISLGTETAKTALEMIILGGPIGVLVGIIGLLIGATLAYEGYQKQATAATMRRDAELQKKQAAIYDQLYKDFNQVGQSSMTASGGMTQLWRQLGQLGLATKDIAKFTKIVGESGQALAMFGASTVEGLQKFTDVAESVKNKFGETFRRMGIDQDALNEHTLKYMETQVSLGGLEKKNNQEVAAGVRNYVLELDRVATLTGLNRKDLEKGRDAIRAISQLAAAKDVAMMRGDKGRLAEIEVTEKIAGAMQKTMPQMAEALAKFQSHAALDQNQVVMLQYLGPMIDAMKKGETDQIRLNELAAKGMEEYQHKIASYTNIIGEQQGVSLDSYKAISDFRATVKGSREKTEKEDANTPPGAPKYDPGEELTRLRTSLDAFTNSQVQAQFNAKQLQIALEHDVRGTLVAMPNAMGAAMLEFLPKAFREPLEKFMAHIAEFGRFVMGWSMNNPMMAAGIAGGALLAYKLFAGKMAGIAADKAEDKLVGKLADALGKTGQTGGTTVAQTAGTTVAQTAGTRMERVRKGAGWVMREVPAGPAAGGVPGMPSGGGMPGGGGSSSASEIIKTLAQPDILKNLGTGAGQGLAGFLRAFADPIVVGGAAGLATSIGLIITGIGAGIAGASWIMGKTLPTLMEGIKSFEQLDGNKLEAAGLGIGYLGTGLAVFGVGGAAAGIGSLIGNLSDGLTNFFGKTPIEKLVEFSKLDIDGPKVKNNAEAFAIFASAMGAAGVAEGVSGIGVFIGALGDGLAKMFGTDLPVDKLIKFSKLDIDGPKVKSNAEAFIAFSKAMTASGVSESVSGVGKIVDSIGDGVTRLLKGTTPIDKFVSFSKLDIDVKRSKNNAEAFVEFSKAFAQGGVAGIAGGFGTMMGGLADGFLAMFGKKDIIDKFVDFAKLNIDPKKTKEMAEAFAAFATGMSGGYGGGAGGAGKSSPSTSSHAYSMQSQGGSGKVQATSLDQLKAAGLKMESKTGDLQQSGAKIDPELIEIAKRVQAGTPGFQSFTGFNDRYHQENTPESRHTKGLAFDMVVGLEPGTMKPGKDYDKNIQKAIYAAGGKSGIYVKNEYENPSDKATGGHYHVELPLKAYDGGIFDGPKAGYPVELHGREAIVPLPNPGDKLAMNKAQKDGSAKKGALSSVVADNTTATSSNDSAILIDLYSMMEQKFDSLIDKMDKNNNYTNKLLKYSMG